MAKFYPFLAGGLVGLIIRSLLFPTHDDIGSYTTHEVLWMLEAAIPTLEHAGVDKYRICVQECVLDKSQILVGWEDKEAGFKCKCKPKSR